MLGSLIHGIILAIAAAMAATQPAIVHFDIDLKQDVHPISRFIYGVNQPLTGPYARATFTRLGGNRWSAYNWTNNASNAGNDWHYQNDNFLSTSDSPAAAMIPGIDNARDHDAGILLTIPMTGYVSRDKNGDGDVHNSGPDYLSKRFLPESPAKNSPFTLAPDPNAPVIFQDEMVNFLKTKYPDAQSDPDRPIWFDLDNEPGLWFQTHAEVHPEPATYAELIQKSIEFAAAAKNVWPQTLIFGGVNYGWQDFIRLQKAPDADGRDFQEVFLAAMAEAEKSRGKRLIDILDIHWYPSVKVGNVRITDVDSSPDVAAARIQAPRSLWDPDYVESSWITRDQLHGPIHLIPRLKDKIARNYPGTKLSISEYNFGGWNDISGAIAEADVLGILGREDVFAANEWPLGNPEPFIAGAFEMYRDFDGRGSAFGDISVHAQSDEIEAASIYAGISSTEPGTLILIAINKTDHDLTAALILKNAPSYKSADIYRLIGASPAPQSAGKFVYGDANPILLALPAYSVETIRLRTSDAESSTHP
jgi:hypothetical protein